MTHIDSSITQTIESSILIPTHFLIDKKYSFFLPFFFEVPYPPLLSSKSSEKPFLSKYDREQNQVRQDEWVKTTKVSKDQRSFQNQRKTDQRIEPTVWLRLTIEKKTGTS